MCIQRKFKSWHGKLRPHQLTKVAFQSRVPRARDKSSNLDPKLVSFETSSKHYENDDEEDKISKVKKVRAKVDSRRKQWSKKQQYLMFEEWRKQRGFKWDQTKKGRESVSPTNYNRYDVRIFTCIKFNKCAVLYTHAS